MMYDKLEDLQKIFKEKIEDKFNKRVYFDDNGKCKIGTIIGITDCYLKLTGDIDYVIEYRPGKIAYVPITQSITLL